MGKEFCNHIKKITEIAEEEFPEILSYFKTIQVNKKEIIGSAGKECDTHYFVIKGCLHMYFINDKGKEQTLQFAIENWWMTDYLAFYHQRKSDFNIQAVEASQLLSIDYQSQQQLLEKFPIMEKYFRIIFQIGYGAALMRIKYMFDYSKEEIFFRFSEQQPEFIQRVPQYLIASYLGLTPEYVSEIRRKKLS